MNPISTIGFIGFGLIGGSIARALKELPESFHLLAFDYHKETKNNSLYAAYSDGILDGVTQQLTDFSDRDLIFLCAPVLRNIEYLELLKPIISSNCILTDVGSVKSNIHEAVTHFQLDKNFIGGHPMAGSEKTGYENSYAALLENAYYILTPTSMTKTETLNKMINFIKKLNALPIVLDAKEHDNITAAISHVPHIIAAELVNLVRTCDDEAEKRRMLAAGGFKDITRIASSSPIMWQNICLTNTDSICSTLDHYITSLTKVSVALREKNSDYLYQIFETANNYRSSIPNQSSGMITKIHEVYLDITDEPGAIASIATLLGSNSISIKNIGIIHNREFEQGVLRIEFYKEEALHAAIHILKAKNYTIYERN